MYINDKVARHLLAVAHVVHVDRTPLVPAAEIPGHKLVFSPNHIQVIATVSYTVRIISYNEKAALCK